MCAGYRVSVVAAAWLAGMMQSVAPAIAQTRGEIHAGVVRGRDSVVALGGVTAGGGLLVGGRGGVEAEAGLILDDSDERALAPMLSVGGTWRVGAPRTAVPLVSAGLTRLGNVGRAYLGGGLVYRVLGSVGVRAELRAA